MRKQFFQKYTMKKFSTLVRKELKLDNKDIKQLNNLMKEPYVKPGTDKIVK